MVTMVLAMKNSNSETESYCSSRMKLVTDTFKSEAPGFLFHANKNKKSFTIKLVKSVGMNVGLNVFVQHYSNRQKMMDCNWMTNPSKRN